MELEHTAYNHSDYAINLYPDIITNDYSFLLNELQSNIDKVVSYSSIYQPNLMPSIKSLVDAFNDTIARLKEAFESSKDHRIINNLIDWLMQGNSSLSYMYSQALTGNIPFIQNPSLFGAFSLLGVGSAHNAIHKFSHYINSIFKHHPLADALCEGYGNNSGVEICKNVLQYNHNWEGINHNKSISTSDKKAFSDKIVFFSGRMGFSESHHAVTCAIQTLLYADTPLWNIMTLSHELLHSHVTGIIDSLLQSYPTEDGSLWNSLAKEYNNNVDALDMIAKRNLRSSLILMLINYAINYYYIETNTKESSALSGEEIKRCYLSHYKIMNEIIVHTLDFHYFYDSSPDLYIKAIWTSWASIPSVLEDIELYIIRTIAAISTIYADTDKIHDRFMKAVTKFKICLSDIAGEKCSNSAVKAALECVQENPSSGQCIYGELFKLYLINSYLSDLTYKFLYIPDIKANLMGGDANIQDADGEQVYALNTCEFSGASVVNPVVFVKDRLSRCHDNTSEFSSEYKSLWELIAINSN